MRSRHTAERAVAVLPEREAQTTTEYPSLGALVEQVFPWQCWKMCVFLCPGANEEPGSAERILDESGVHSKSTLQPPLISMHALRPPHATLPAIFN